MNNQDISEKLFRIIKDVTGVTKDEIKSKSRKTEIKQARSIFCKMMLENSNYSSVKIGEMIEKDHSNVLRACQYHKRDFMDDHRGYRTRYAECMKIFLEMDITVNQMIKLKSREEIQIMLKKTIGYAQLLTNVLESMK